MAEPTVAMRPVATYLATLENELKVVRNVKNSGCAQKAATLDEDIKMIVKAARDRAINLRHLVAKEGQGRNVEIYTVAYTVSHF